MISIQVTIVFRRFVLLLLLLLLLLWNLPVVCAGGILASLVCFFSSFFSQRRTHLFNPQQMITNSVSVLLHSHPHFRQTYVAYIVDILGAILVSPVPLILCTCLCFHQMNVAYGLYFSGHFGLIGFSYPVFLHVYASTKSVLLKLHVLGSLRFL